MKSIFNSNDNKAYIERIKKLSSSSEPLWGKMSVSEMLIHCQKPMDVAFGKLDLKMNLVMRLMGKIFKNKVLNGAEFQKNSPTVKEFIVKEALDFETAKKGLIERLNTFSLQKETAIKNDKHPFFGKLTTEEWGKLQTKHLEHHLAQFGV